MLDLYLRLTPKQKRFAEKYVLSFGNGPQAALEVYDCDSRRNARVMAFKNLHNPKVLAYIEHLLAQSAIAQKVVDTLSKQLDATKFLKVNAELVEIPDWKARSKAVNIFVNCLLSLDF